MKKTLIIITMTFLITSCGGIQDPSKKDLKSPCVGNGGNIDPCARRDILLNTYFSG